MARGNPLQWFLLSASATAEITSDILQTLSLKRYEESKGKSVNEREGEMHKKTVICRSSLIRPNIFLRVIPKEDPDSVREWILHFLNSHSSDESGLIYCLTQKDCESLNEFLKVTITSPSLFSKRCF